MRLLGIGAMALTLGLGGCMHAMDRDHHDRMMGGMMGQHDSANCPRADEAQHGAEAQAGEAAHEHPAGAPECPRANEAGPHQHDQPPQPN